MLVEKVTRKIEIDENNGSHIHIRKTTHIIDDVTGEHKGSTHHRLVVECDNDVHAAKEDVTDIANLVWTPESRDKAKKNKNNKKGK